jgi:rhamnogalacturonyl hydrolase YesR
VISDFATFTTAQSPTTIGNLAANSFINNHINDTYAYPVALTWYGALKLTVQTQDQTMQGKLITGFAPYLNGTTTVVNGAGSTDAVDNRVFGVLPLEIFLINNDANAKTLGLARADAQWAGTADTAVTPDARYWADDMFMITGLQVQAYRATKDMKYLTRATTAMLSYFTALQQTSGLFWHTKNVHILWGRANGWVAAGAAELLLELPAGSMRDQIMAGFKKQMAGLLPLQVSSPGTGDDGLWRQVLDDTAAPTESSSSAMFTFTLITGLKNGWLDEPTYGPPARKAWLGLLANTDGSGQIDKVCIGTGAPDTTQYTTIAQQTAYYVGRQLTRGDLHGEAPLLWSAAALLRTDCPGMR